jgi:penicillin-binding protein 1A
LEDYDRGLGLWRGATGRIDPALLNDEAEWRRALQAVSIPRDIDGWVPAVVLSAGRDQARIGVEGGGDDPASDHIIPAADVTWARPVNADGSRGRQARGPDDLLEPGDVIHVMAIPRDGDDGVQQWSLRQMPLVQGGFMAMDVNTGRVLAMQGGFSYQQSSFNRATQATRQPGSAFKTLVYAAALDSGYSPNTIVIDAPIELETPEGIWRPQNASERFYGPSPLRTGIEMSRNLMTVRLANDVGMDTIARYAERFGVYDRMQPFLANSLGSQETTLFRMVAAYAMFANGGERVDPTLVDRIQDRWGNTVYRHDQRQCPDCQLAALGEGRAPAIMSNRQRVIDPVTAYQITSMMRGVVDRGTAARTVNLSVPAAGKTGTTNEARDVWFVGYTSSIAAGCYIGFDQPRPMGRGASGGGMCGPVFNEFMQAATEEYGGGPFAVPESGAFFPIDRFSGQRLADGAAGDHVVYELFRAGEEPATGALAIIDGGWGMGSDLPIYDRGDGAPGDEAEGQGQTVTTSTGGAARVPTQSGFGTLSSGGLY